MKRDIFMNSDTNLAHNLSTDKNTNEQLLHFILQDGIVTTSEIENYIIMTRKNQVTKVHQTPFYQRSDGRYFTKVKDCGNTNRYWQKMRKLYMISSLYSILEKEILL